MVRRILPLALMAALAGCWSKPDSAPVAPARSSPDPADGNGTQPPADDGKWLVKGATLPDARKGFRTKLVHQEKANEPLDQPPAKVFQVASS